MKKLFTMALAGALALTVACPAFAAAPAPVLSFGFEEDEGMTITGGALTEDTERGKVLTLDGGAKNSSSANIDTDVFSTADWADGMTIAFWVKAAKSEPGISPLYSFSIVDHDAEGYVATTDSLEIAINTDGNSGAAEYPRVWADPSVVDATAQPVLNAGTWQHVAVTLSSTGMTIYLDGEVYSNPVLGPSSANFKLFLEQIPYFYGLQLGNWNCGWWEDIGSFAGSYDDVYVFNSALSQEDVQTVMNASFAEITGSGADMSPAVIAIVVVAVVAVAAVVVILRKKKSAEAKKDDK